MSMLVDCSGDLGFIPALLVTGLVLCGVPHCLYLFPNLQHKNWYYFLICFEMHGSKSDSWEHYCVMMMQSSSKITLLYYSEIMCSLLSLSDFVHIRNCYITISFRILQWCWGIPSAFCLLDKITNSNFHISFSYSRKDNLKCQRKYILKSW